MSKYRIKDISLTTLMILSYDDGASSCSGSGAASGCLGRLEAGERVREVEARQRA